MRERDFQRRITDIATRHGWKWWHVPAPMRKARDGVWRGAPEAAGLPDLILMHHNPPRIVFLELKGDGGRLENSQREFLHAAETVAEWSFHHGEGYNDTWNIGVFAAWPKDEPIIEQMLRTKVVK